MENKCKNCMCYHQAFWHSDGTKGTCGQSGELRVHNREDICDCGYFMEMSRVEKVRKTLMRDLHAWIRERDSMYRRSMELVWHIGQLFEQGEFKIFDIVKSAQDMKGLVYNNNHVITEIDTVWTYHCPWDEEKDLFIAITTNGTLVVNEWDGTNFRTEWHSIEDEFELCMEMIDKIRMNCVTKVHVNDVVTETEMNKCVSDEPLVKRPYIQ